MGRFVTSVLSLLVLALALASCGGSTPQEGAMVKLTVESSAFGEGAAIPKQHTCDGQNLSPPLSWSDPPAGTQSLALICDDPDAPGGTFVHWVAFNLPATARSLPEGTPSGQGTIPGGGSQGTNSGNRLGYSGPCPPKGSTHRYYFKLYALDTILNLDPGASKADLERAMTGHILAEGQLMGRYGR